MEPWQRVALWIGTRSILGAVFWTLLAVGVVVYAVTETVGEEAGEAWGTVTFLAAPVLYVACRLWAGKQVVEGRIPPGPEPWRLERLEEPRPAREAILEAPCILIPVLPSRPGGQGQLYATEEGMIVSLPGAEVLVRYPEIKWYDIKASDSRTLELETYPPGNYTVVIDNHERKRWLQFLRDRDIPTRSESQS